MITQRAKAAIVITLFITFLAGPAAAALTTIGTATYDNNNYKLIYDNDSPMFGSIVWLDYSNAPDTWANQMAWAGSLNRTGTITYNFKPGYSMNWSGVWRLPQGGGFGDQNAYIEMGHLYYTELGNVGCYPDLGCGLINKGPFSNLQQTVYWSGTEFDPPFDDTPGRAWEFSTADGFNYHQTEVAEDNALAVRPGKLETATVPIPSTLLLFGGGLSGLMGLRFRRRGRSTFDD